MIRTLVLAAAALALSAGGGCESAAPPEHAAAEHSHHDHSGEHHHHHDGHAHGHDAHDGAHAHDHASLHPSSDPSGPCTCASAKLHNAWCARCNVGYVAGRAIASAILFETLDPHGHELDLSQLTCATCAGNVATDGFCDACGMGFYERQAYFTRLTHALAQGRASDVSSIACAICRSNVEAAGWCESCARGMVGNVAFEDRDLHERAASEYRILLAAIDRAPQCELCACAMVAHRTCPTCRISYERAGAAHGRAAPAHHMNEGGT